MSVFLDKRIRNSETKPTKQACSFVHNDVGKYFYPDSPSGNTSTYTLVGADHCIPPSG